VSAVTRTAWLHRTHGVHAVINFEPEFTCCGRNSTKKSAYTLTCVDKRSRLFLCLHDKSSFLLSGRNHERFCRRLGAGVVNRPVSLFNIESADSARRLLGDNRLCCSGLCMYTALYVKQFSGKGILFVFKYT